MITRGRVVIDCRPRPEDEDDDWLGQATARLVQTAAYVPAGADVVLIVGEKQHPAGIDYLVREGAHIGTLTVESSCSTAVGRWLQAIREVA